MGSQSLLEELLSVNPRVEEERYRARESLVESRVEPPIALRLDGVGFGRALRGFQWPRDRRVHEALLETAELLMDRMGADVAYVGSDEINLVVFGEPPYAGRVEKLVSISAGLASAAFSLKLGRVLYFDSRIIPLDGREDAARYLLYRARVVFNNYVNSMLAAQGVRVERLEGGLARRIALLRERGVNPLTEPWASLGSCLARVHARKRRCGVEAERRRTVWVDGPCRPLILLERD